MPQTTVSKKGWVVIPKEIRKKYGIRPGDKFQVVDEDGLITLVPAHEDPVKAAWGMFSGGPSLMDELLDYRRQERELEEEKYRRLTGHDRNEDKPGDEESAGF